ncbi:MAG: PIN domain-containing protein [Burkholderiales bacterium]|nr:PIN domain-containing protein [Burkholderiales bacterium]
MRLLLDINILLDVAFQRPGEPASSRVIARCGHEHKAWLAWHSVATLAYLVERQESADQAREFVRGLLAWADVAVTQRSDALQALDWPMADFEDALQAAAAVACGAQFIITRNLRDFKGSPVRATTPELFLASHGPEPAPPPARAQAPRGKRST